MRTLYVPGPETEIWDQFAKAAADLGMSTSALLMALIRAYLDGKITVTRAEIEVRDATDKA